MQPVGFYWGRTAAPALPHQMTSSRKGEPGPCGSGDAHREIEVVLRMRKILEDARLSPHQPIRLNRNPESFEAAWGGVAVAVNKAALREKHLPSSAARRQGWEQCQARGQNAPHEPANGSGIPEPDQLPITLPPVQQAEHGQAADHHPPRLRFRHGRDDREINALERAHATGRQVRDE